MTEIEKAERERLKDLISKAPKTDVVYGDIKLKEPIQTLETITDYLLANGVIVPPCKVGDTVYVVSQGQGFNCRWSVYKGKVTDIHLDCHNELTIRVENGEKFFGYYKSCFIHKTELEAEKALTALKEREQG